MHTLVALMPMRHNSERVPGKNYRPFGDGRPLFRHMLDTLLACDAIDLVVIDTDSPTIAEICAADYPGVRVLDRPEHLRDGATPMNAVILHDMEQVPSRFYLQTHSTNPLVRPETVKRAVDAFLAGYPSFDSLFSVMRYQTRLWDALARPVNHNADILMRTQDLPPLYEENSCLYIFEGETMRARWNRIGARPQQFEMTPWESRDIDEEIDFSVAEMMFQSRSREA